MTTHAFKILRCQHCKVFEVCLAIFQHYAWKVLNRETHVRRCLYYSSSRFADVIDMSWCVEFTDKAMEMFMDRCVPCKEFYIRGMENVKGEPLKTIDENMPHLQLLDIAFCKNIPEDTIKEIQRKNPKLEIIYKDGERFVPSAT